MNVLLDLKKIQILKNIQPYVKNKNVKSYLFMVNFFMCIIKMFH